MNEITIELEGIELDIYYVISPLSGIDIAYIYHGACEVSMLFNHYAVARIKDLVWQAIK